MRSLRSLPRVLAVVGLTTGVMLLPAAAQADSYAQWNCDNGTWIEQTGPNGTQYMWYDQNGNWGYGSGPSGNCFGISM